MGTTTNQNQTTSRRQVWARPHLEQPCLEQPRGETEPDQLLTGHCTLQLQREGDLGLGDGADHGHLCVCSSWGCRLHAVCACGVQATCMCVGWVGGTGCLCGVCGGGDAGCVGCA